MRQRQEITIFSTSFLDLLSCGMGAVVLLCLVFAASRKMQGEVSGETTFFTLAVDSPISSRGKPQLRVTVVIDGTVVEPGQTEVIRGTKVSIQPSEPSNDSYQVIVTGEGLTSLDRVTACVVDLNGVHSSSIETPGKGTTEIIVKTMRSGPGGTVESEIKLPVTRPMVSAALEGIESATFDPKWE